MAGVPIIPENKISDMTPWRGQKHGLYEGGHRVPAIAWWPGRITPGRISDELCATMDLMPTCLELAGAEIGKSDGISLASHLLARSPTLPDRALFWRNGASRAVRWKQWKVVRIHERPFELYRLDDDPAERRNLAESHPEVMKDLLQRWRTWESEVSPD